jgi:phage recombination protein Bet
MSDPKQAVTKPVTGELTKEERVIAFVPFGAIDQIKLSVRMIQDFIAKPTKQGKKCTPDQALRFLMLCQAQRLNPWQGDCFCIGYDTQNGPEFSNVVAHQTFLKRAEANENYDGMTSGLIVRNKETQAITEIEGDFFLDEEQQVLGGWAKVIRKDRKIPFYRRIRMARFYKDQSQWKVDAPGMICKCAEADALRSAFPTVLGGLYMPEEMQAAREQLPPAMSRPLFSLPSLVPAAEAENGTNGFKEPAQEMTPPSDAIPVEQTPPGANANDKAGTPEPPAVKSPLADVRKLCKIANIGEGEILEYLAAIGTTDGSAGNLDEVKSDVLAAVVKDWKAVVEKVKAARAGEDTRGGLL